MFMELFYQVLHFTRSETCTFAAV